MEETINGTKEEKNIYKYSEFPKNVRQIGVPLPGQKIYLEDYVITYLKQSFVHAQEPVVVLLLGKNGEEKAEKAAFIYGAIVLEETGILEKGEIPKETWDQAYETIRRNFPGALVLGWACGVPMWSGSVDSQVRKLQKAEFSKENSTLFLWDLSEKEEKIFLWQRNMLKEMSGYYVYFEKNPQMQNFMLDDSKDPEIIDGDYEDTVTVSMRHVIEEKEERKKNLQLLAYCGAVAAGIALLFGVHTMLDSTARIQKMEQTVDTLTEYVGKQQEDVAAMSRQAADTVQQIPFQSAENTTDTPKPSDAGTVSKRKTTGQVQPAQEKKQKTFLPSKGKTGSGETDVKRAERTSTRTEQQSYIVRKGDTLSQIVWKQYHDLSYEKKVKKANGLKDADAIYEGQCLVLPKYKK